MRTLFIDSIGLVLKRMWCVYAGSSFALLRSYFRIFKRLNAPGRCRSPSPEDAPQESADARTIAQDDRFERSFHADLNRYNSEGITGQSAAKISEKEARDVLEGKLPDGTEIPVYPFDEFRRGVADLPTRYGVILDYEIARKSTRGYDTFDVLKDEPNLIVRAGGVGPLAAYLDKFRDRHNTKTMGNWHPYNRIDPDQPQTRIPFLAGNKGGVGSDIDEESLWGYDEEYGLGGDASMVGMARYVAVARRNVSTSLQNLDFEI